MVEVERWSWEVEVCVCVCVCVWVVHASRVVKTTCESVVVL